MACFVKVTVCRFRANLIQTIPSKLHDLLRLQYIESVQNASIQLSYEMLTRWKPSSYFEWTAISTFFDKDLDFYVSV